mmetsp:Transcript_27666/g.36932  ORF Transcript_27666/g.36932 Transcript_27666/m.36932 type:complete len:213 (+) Transcript_27666:123-761(+)
MSSSSGRQPLTRNRPSPSSTQKITTSARGSSIDCTLVLRPSGISEKLMRLKLRTPTQPSSPCRRSTRSSWLTIATSKISLLRTGRRASCTREILTSRSRAGAQALKCNTARTCALRSRWTLRSRLWWSGARSTASRRSRASSSSAVFFRASKASLSSKKTSSICALTTPRSSLKFCLITSSRIWSVMSASLRSTLSSTASSSGWTTSTANES